MEAGADCDWGYRMITMPDAPLPPGSIVELPDALPPPPQFELKNAVTFAETLCPVPHKDIADVK